jgi:hypothetical protein
LNAFDQSALDFFESLPGMRAKVLEVVRETRDPARRDIVLAGKLDELARIQVAAGDLAAPVCDLVNAWLDAARTYTNWTRVAGRLLHRYGPRLPRGAPAPSCN